MHDLCDSFIRIKSRYQLVMNCTAALAGGDFMLAYFVLSCYATLVSRICVFYGQVSLTREYKQ